MESSCSELDGHRGQHTVAPNLIGLNQTHPVTALCVPDDHTLLASVPRSPEIRTPKPATRNCGPEARRHSPPPVRACVILRLSERLERTPVAGPATATLSRPCACRMTTPSWLRYLRAPRILTPEPGTLGSGRMIDMYQMARGTTMAPVK